MNVGLAGIAALIVSGSVIGSGVKIPDVNRTYYIYSDVSEDDLINQSLITEADMEYLIDIYAAKRETSALYGTAWAFIEASNRTGLDPIFLFSLTGIESGWGSSDIHVRQCNPYSLGMYGDGVHNGYDVADSFAEGIIAGAELIKDEYYDAGQTTLYLMNHNGDHSFCAEDPSWEEQIGRQMRCCRKLLKDR